LDNADNFSAVTNGQTWNAGALLNEALFQNFPCLDGAYSPPSPDDLAYPAGDYEVYVVSQVFASAPSVALRELADQGYVLASMDWGMWNPGSIDCQQALEFGGGGGVPVQCLAVPPSGVTLDPETDIVTLPFHSASYSGDLDVTLVSQPIDVVLDRDVTFGDMGYTSPSTPTSAPDPTEPFACGEFTSGFGSSLQSSFATPPAFDDVVSGIEVPILVDIELGADKTRGTLHVAEGATAAVVLSGGYGNGWVTDLGTPLITPADVPIDRANGYPDVSIRLDNATECPAPTEGPWTLLNRDPAATGWSLEIRGDFRIDWEDGTTTTAQSITLNGLSEG